jgi:hypothetical protein
MQEPHIELEKPNPGELLVAAGLITQDVLEQALAEQRRTSLPVSRILVEQGHVSPTVMARAIAGPPEAEPPIEQPPVSSFAGLEPPVSTPQPAPLAVVPAPVADPAPDPRIAELEAQVQQLRDELAARATPEPTVLVGPVTVYAPAAVIELDGERYAVAKIGPDAPDAARVVEAFRQAAG